MLAGGSYSSLSGDASCFLSCEEHTTQLPASQELTALLGDMSCYGR